MSHIIVSQLERISIFPFYCGIDPCSYHRDSFTPSKPKEIPDFLLEWDVNTTILRACLNKSISYLFFIETWLPLSFTIIASRLIYFEVSWSHIPSEFMWQDPGHLFCSSLSSLTWRHCIEPFQNSNWSELPHENGILWPLGYLLALLPFHPKMGTSWIHGFHVPNVELLSIFFIHFHSHD